MKTALLLLAIACITLALPSCNWTSPTGRFYSWYPLQRNKPYTFEARYGDDFYDFTLNFCLPVIGCRLANDVDVAICQSWGPDPRVNSVPLGEFSTQKISELPFPGQGFVLSYRDGYQGRSAEIQVGCSTFAQEEVSFCESLINCEQPKFSFLGEKKGLYTFRVETIRGCATSNNQ